MSEKEYRPLVDGAVERSGDPRHEGHRHRHRQRSRLYNHLVPAVLLIFAIALLFRKVFPCHGKYDASHGLQKQIPEEEYSMMHNGNHTRIPLEAHIMSKCPDAKDCLEKLVVPAMEEISDKVDFRLSYIGSYDPNSDAVSCMHGPPECLGNIIQLCAADIYREPKIYLAFANCMISDYRRVPDRDLVESCAYEHGIDFKSLNDCISDEGKGVGLLRDSVQRSKDHNVTKSCTVRLNGKVRCIRDGGTWYDCPGGSNVEDLVADVNALYDAKNSS